MELPPEEYKNSLGFGYKFPEIVERLRLRMKQP
jgi:hypothetical protein